MGQSEKPQFRREPEKSHNRFDKPDDQRIMATQSSILKTASILIVDDEFNVRRVTVRVAQSAGYTDITDMDNRDNALKLIEQLTSQGKTILCISDFNMPKNMDYNTFRNEALKRNPNIRIILMTGNIVEANEAGATADIIITKPFDVEKLKENINLLLSKKI